MNIEDIVPSVLSIEQFNRVVAAFDLIEESIMATLFDTIKNSWYIGASGEYSRIEGVGAYALNMDVVLTVKAGEYIQSYCTGTFAGIVYDYTIDNPRWRVHPLIYLAEPKYVEILSRGLAVIDYPNEHPGYRLLYEKGYGVSDHERIELLLAFRNKLREKGIELPCKK